METKPHSPRFLRGLAIARVGRVRQLRDGVWSVPSQSHKGAYLVGTAGDRPACCCPDFEDNGNAEGFECESTFAIDSSGFSTCTYARWFDHKWGKERKRQKWVTAVLAHNLCVLIMATYELGVAVEFWGSTHGESHHVH